MLYFIFYLMLSYLTTEDPVILTMRIYTEGQSGWDWLLLLP